MKKKSKIRKAEKMIMAKNAAWKWKKKWLISAKRKWSWNWSEENEKMASINERSEARKKYRKAWEEIMKYRKIKMRNNEEENNENDVMKMKASKEISKRKKKIAMWNNEKWRRKISKEESRAKMKPWMKYERNEGKEKSKAKGESQRKRKKEENRRNGYQ